MNHDLIKELCDTPGVPGCEDAISSIVLREIEDLCVAYLKDPMGNLIFQVNDTIPEAPTILIDAHMDEVGFIVSHIEDNGMLRVIPLGGIDPKLFYGQRLTIWGKEKVESTVAAIPPHISDKNSSGSIPVDDCLIDTGISPNKINTAFKWLKENNPLYKDVEYDEGWEKALQEEDPRSSMSFSTYEQSIFDSTISSI